MLCLAPLVPAIAAGNCAIIKPSELAPHCNQVVKKIIKESLDERFYRVYEGKSKVAVTLNK